jgi:hypothetical protein
MKNLTGRLLHIFIMALVALALSRPPASFAGDVALDVQSIMHDTQQIKYESHRMVIAWWIPEEYWRASLAVNGSLTQAQIAHFLKLVKPYTLVILIKSKYDTSGNFTFEDEDAMRTSVSLIDANRVHYAPIDTAEVSAEVEKVISVMKPILAKALGPMGKNLGFFVFPAKGKDGNVIADAHQEGVFSVATGDDQFRWRLPLGSVLPPKTCPKCTEVLSGAYKFCPYDGTPLDK